MEAYTAHVSTHTTTDVAMDVELVAKWFCGLNDEQQAQFFIEVARTGLTWTDPGHQWWGLGRHLKKCGCSTDEARTMLCDIAAAIKYECEPIAQRA